MNAKISVPRLFGGLLLSGLLVCAQQGGGKGGGSIGGNGGGHAAASGGGTMGGHSRSAGMVGGAARGNSGSIRSSGGVGFRNQPVNPGYPSGGAFPAGVRSTPYAPFRSSSSVDVYRHGQAYGPWRTDRYRGRSRYVGPYTYFAPYGFSYLGAPYYGDDGGSTSAGVYDSDVDPNTSYDEVGQMASPVGVPYDPNTAPPEEQYGPSYPPQTAAPYPPAPVASDPLPSTPPLRLVLNSGERLQVQNYAIVGKVFWNLSSHPVRKIALNSIDIQASTAASEAAGAEFPAVAANQ